MLLGAGGLVGGCGSGASSDRCADDRCAAQGGAGGRPTRIAINHDDYKAKHVGHTADGRQFFLTMPFDTGTEAAGGAREFVALYIFDAAGTFLEAKIDAVGGGAQTDPTVGKTVYATRLRQLGKVTFDRIVVAPFSVMRFHTTFGLVADEPAGDGNWWVTAQPGNYMAFAAPWDSGVYDT